MQIRFRGEHIQRVDDKSRLSIPASYRQALERSGVGRLVLVKSTLSPCLQGWPVADWEAYENKIMALPPSDPTVQKLLRFQVSSSVEIEPDGHGRVVLPATLRAYAGIQPGSEVVIAGHINKFEVWTRERWQPVQDDLSASLAEWTADLARLGL